MAVTIQINGKTSSNSLVHKGSNAFIKSTLPDVCKTSTPGGPVPIPYPVIFSFAKDLKKGTKTVKADGKKMIAVKGSEFSRCTGDEPGKIGGVKSNTNMKEAKWLMYSFNVKMDGKNACRFKDKMMMNHANTIGLAGAIQVPVAVLEGTEFQHLCKLAKECNSKVEKSSKWRKKPCRERGTAKHKCCENAIKEYNKTNESNLRSEVAYNKNGEEIADNIVDDLKKKAGEAYQVAKAAGKTGKELKKVWPSVFFGSSDSVYLKADVVEGDPKKAYDFKFNCKNNGYMSKKQKDKYRKIFKKEPELIHPKSSACNPPNKP